MDSTAFPPVEQVEQAFLQLDFAVKLLSYFEAGKVIKTEFDSAHRLQLLTGTRYIGENTFHTYDDLIIGAENVYRLTAAACAIAMDSALDEAGMRHDPNDDTADGRLRTLVYMIRNSYAHNIMQPRWSIKPKYRRQVEVSLVSRTLVVDYAALHGQRFEDPQVGGWIGYFEIKDAVLGLLARGTERR